MSRGHDDPADREEPGPGTAAGFCQRTGQAHSEDHQRQRHDHHNAIPATAAATAGQKRSAAATIDVRRIQPATPPVDRQPELRQQQQQQQRRSTTNPATFCATVASHLRRQQDRHADVERDDNEHHCEHHTSADQQQSSDQRRDDQRLAVRHCRQKDCNPSEHLWAAQVFGTLPVQEVLQVERFPARRLHHVASHGRQVAAVARMAGQ